MVVAQSYLKRIENNQTLSLAVNTSKSNLCYYKYMAKNDVLNKIHKKIIDHPSNGWAKRQGYQPLYTADVDAKIAIIGQAPGRKAQESMIPWDDKSGDVLRQWLELSREEFYDETLVSLIPMDFYYPGKGAHGDLPPRKDFADRWHPKILAEMPKIKLTVLIGNYAQKYYLEKKAKKNLTETVRAYEEYLPQILPLVHPSPLNFRWQAKNPWFNTEVVPAARRLVRGVIKK